MKMLRISFINQIHINYNGRANFYLLNIFIYNLAILYEGDPLPSMWWHHPFKYD